MCPTVVETNNGRGKLGRGGTGAEDENVVERVLEHHQQHLSQPNTKAGEPSKRASGGELHYCTSLPCEITSCHQAITKEIGMATEQ